MEYPAKGSPLFAAKTINLLGDGAADKTWGLDHGTWSVLSAMYPAADIPVFQLSIDGQASPVEEFAHAGTGKRDRHDEQHPVAFDDPQAEQP